MTTIAVDLRAMVIAADTQNTDSAGTKFRCWKIEKFKDGRIFLGSGHLLGIGKVKRWAGVKFAEKHRPDFEELFGECRSEFGFSCIVIDQYGAVTLVDEEMEPQPILDSYFAIGSGSHFAVGAMDAGASVEDAVRIACKRDPNSSEPLSVVRIPKFRKRK